MFGIILAGLLALALYAITRLSGATRGNLFPVLLAGYVARLALQLFVRDLPLFSHATGGGDFTLY